MPELPEVQSVVNYYRPLLTKLKLSGITSPNNFNKVFDIIFSKAKTDSPITGSNFWAWGGFGRPSKPKAIWAKNDDFIGDPPHEFQGWYSVYNTDLSTIKIIKNFTTKFNDI